MLVQVQWLSYCKESELDRPELFKRIDELNVEDRIGNDIEQLKEEVKKEIVKMYDVANEEVQIIKCHIENSA
ncbi:hypothetical protein SAMN05421743_101379 [Thalassobacillus cyri]|uniref:Uncharacterized protein n=1 Tax=Thalassobacillus cyri TaxID=571932 RepID=A0A1H3WA64_9BACI|nr:hypothetical protein [Thalassobacillus cyri]SDZ83986.1 hypothetical protein SAMN05421743_101379 [Thalassobacillus cyri]